MREINFYLNSRERDPPSTLQRPASISVWTLDVPITLQNPENYFQISVRGFYAEPNLVISYIDNPALSDAERNWVRFTPLPYVPPPFSFSVIFFLPSGNYTPVQLISWFNGLGISNLAMSQNVYNKCTINNTFSGAIEIDFSVNLYKAFGFGASMYGYTQASPDISLPPVPADTGFTIAGNSMEISGFPLSTARDRTLFVLYNGGTVDNYSITTNESRTYPGGGPSGIANSSWVFGRGGQYRERRCIAAISLLSGNPGDKIDFTAQNFVFSRLSEPVIHSISLALATECFQIVPIINADYTIVLAVQECTPIVQPLTGIPQPIVIPKKGEEKDQTKDDRDNEEYIRQLAQQIKKRRLEKAADRVDQSGALAE